MILGSLASDVIVAALLSLIEPFGSATVEYWPS
jgi:hypothetical protein